MSSIVAKFFEKSRLQKEKDLAEEQWIARLHLLKTCGDQIHDDFGNLALYFNLAHKKGGIDSFTSTDGRLMIKLAEKMVTSLDDDLVIVEQQIITLDLLQQKNSRELALEVLQIAQFIRFECVRLKKALRTFQQSCELNDNVGRLQYAISQVPDFEQIRRRL
ncbi:unnamed protein product [Caenorhabditis auriculariae]|uniref:Uncharacterized protein n=1 Tax=Caenorhabditis auriculariae TaxID=2777116 RepID=A0A8S1HNG9_9PELO|nr:unnamed protein product [Caenorhabditis auriculariae]